MRLLDKLPSADLRGTVLETYRVLWVDRLAALERHLDEMPD